MQITFKDIQDILGYLVTILAIIIPASFWPLALTWVKTHIQNKILEPVIYGAVTFLENKTGMTGEQQKISAVEQTEKFVEEYNAKHKHFKLVPTMVGLSLAVEKQVAQLKKDGLEQKGNKNKPLAVPTTAAIDVDENGQKVAPTKEA